MTTRILGIQETGMSLPSVDLNDASDDRRSQDDETSGLLGRLSLLQTCDSVFPVGAFALSNGMETFVQRDMLRSGEDFREYLKNFLEVAPYKELGQMLLAARLTAGSRTIEEFTQRVTKLDSLATALQSAREIREGSHRMCVRLMKLMERMAPSSRKRKRLQRADDDGTVPTQDAQDYGADSRTSLHLVRYQSLVESGRCVGLHPIAMGVYSADNSHDLQDAGLTYGYSLLSALTMCAAKAIPLSQYAGQRALHESFPDLIRAVDVALHLDLDDLGISAAYLDIAAMQHETLYSRLYMS